MNRILEIRDEADADIEEAFHRYQFVSNELATRFLDDLESALEKVRRNPAHYQAVHRDLHRVLLTSFPFAVFYSFSEHTTVVYAVIHQASDPKRWQR